MAIPEKPITECTKVIVNLCGEAKRKVIEKKKEIRGNGMPCSNELAIIKLILEK